MTKISSWLAAIIFLTVTGCATAPPPSSKSDLDIISSNEKFAWVRLKSGHNFEQLAKILLGSRSEAWQLEEINADKTQHVGQLVAVPLQPINPSSVYANEYRTLPILCYHQFTQNSAAAQKLELTSKAFENQIRYLVENDFQILSFQEMETILKGQRSIPERSVVLTIDDGYRSVYDVAWPILKKYKIKATLFVYTDFIGGGKALTWKQIKEMAASGLIEVQSHGKSHASLARLPEDTSLAKYSARLTQDITKSKDAFRRHLGQVPVYISYPYGDSTAHASNLLSRHGFRLAATVTRGLNTTFSDPRLLHRTMIYNDHSMKDFSAFLKTTHKTRAQ